MAGQRIKFEEQTVTGHCPNCDLATSFMVSSSHRIWPKYESPWGVQRASGETEQLTSAVRLRVLTCRFCDKTTTFISEERRDSDGSWVAVDAPRMVWPAAAPRELASEVPDPIRSLFREASECEGAGAMRAAAAIYRATVEELCDDQNASGSTLYDQLEDLRSRMDSAIVDDLHEARLTGNFSLHDRIPFSAEEIEDVADLIVEATTILYVQPQQRSAMREARKKRRGKA